MMSLRSAVSAELSQGPDTPTGTPRERVARRPLLRTLAALAVACVTLTGNAQDRALQSPRLYVFDGGLLASETARYRLKDSEVEDAFLAVASYLVVHPRGVLMWDAGAIADHERTGGVGSEQRLQRRDGQERFVKLAPTLVSQLALAGFKPSDVTCLALSHYHWDHTADANLFAAATWLVPKAERDVMFSEDPPAGTRPKTYSKLRASRTKIVDQDEYDVFGDGSVIIKQAPGHTEGHSVLYVRLRNTGPVVLSGDLYHYRAERTLNRLPTFEVSEQGTRASRAEIEKFLKRMGAELWIQHDLAAFRKMRLAPQYYD